MVITYYGITCFKIEAHGVSLAINPFSKTPGLSAPRFEAAIILATNNSYQNASLPGNPYIICGPGEYDIASATIRSIKLHPNNTAYIIEWDELRLMHLGEFNDGGEKNLDTALKDVVDAIDILFLPIGGTLSPKNAVGVMNALDPAITIPMQFAIKGYEKKLGKLKEFFNVTGGDMHREAKLSIKKRDLLQERQGVVVLKPPYDIL